MAIGVHERVSIKTQLQKNFIVARCSWS